MSKKLPDTAVPQELLNGPEMHDLSHERDNRCVPLAKKLIELLGSMEKMPTGSHVNDKEPDPYLPVVKLFLDELIAKDIKVQEIVYIFNLARQAIQYIETSIDETMNQNMNRVTELVYGLNHNDYNEVTVKQLNTVVNNKDSISEVWKPILEKETQ